MGDRKKLSLILTTTLLIAACAGGGQPRVREIPPERKAELYDRFVKREDINGDGAVTCDDLTITLTNLFNDMNADNNSGLDVFEYRRTRFEDKSYLLQEHVDFDIDENRILSLEEFLAIPNTRFQGFDRDRNCFVTEDEAVNAIIRETRFQFRRPDNGRKGRRPVPELEETG